MKHFVRRKSPPLLFRGPFTVNVNYEKEIRTRGVTCYRLLLHGYLGRKFKNAIEDEAKNMFSPNGATLAGALCPGVRAHVRFAKSKKKKT